MIVLSEPLVESCKSLLQVGIHIFNLMINFDDNTQIYLCNQPNWVHDYYALNLHESSLYDNEPSLFETEYSLWPTEFDQPLLVHGLRYYDNGYGFTICHRHADHTAFYFFAGSSKKSFLPNFFINNIDFLERFIRHFKFEAAPIINRARAAGLMRNVKKTDSPWGKEAVLALKNQNNILYKQKETIELSIQQSQTYNTQLGFVLSPRQKQVLYWHSKGKSAKEIAAILDISSRTVERHFDLLKIKSEGAHVIELILRALDANPSEDLLL